ncbi:hypothetical protein LFM56_05855 [Cellulomonas iranensis]|uniref:hypothetical protein n=1 Tax=Cellulomonas iranensis TaxID=76862 RepID=UPI001CF2594F|nr:hypothetical protein [Cellulomonas iranensis]UCN15837.1 hypothetical protein LFM56_05855 [Cellulomonas iranensis]
MDSDGGRTRTEVDAGDIQIWKEAVTRVRLSQAVVEQCGDPMAGSALSEDDASCPATAKISDAARGVLFAALDNLAMWCNAVAPKVYVEGVPSESASRPHFTLARAGIECAAQAGWLLEPEDRATRIERHLRLVLADMGEEQKAAGRHDPAVAAVLGERIAALKEDHGPIKAAPAYLDMVRATAGRGGVTDDHAEVLWRTASAAAHGKAWFVGAAHITHLGEEFAEGRFRAVHEVNPRAISAVVGFASKLVLWATFQYVSRLGLDFPSLYSSGLAQVASDLPRSVPDVPSETAE